MKPYSHMTGLDTMLAGTQFNDAICPRLDVLIFLGLPRAKNDDGKETFLYCIGAEAVGFFFCFLSRDLSEVPRFGWVCSVVLCAV